MSIETVARLHIVLDEIEPAIWRRVDVPVTASLKMLHDILQAAMGWENVISGTSRPATGATACQTRCGRRAAWPPRRT
jgi:hypothetical protein